MAHVRFQNADHTLVSIDTGARAYVSPWPCLTAAAEEIEELLEGLGLAEPEPYSPPGVTSEDVAAERDRRLEAGFDFDFEDGRGVHRFGTTRADLEGWQEVTQAAQARLALGEAGHLFTIATETGVAQVTAQEWQAVLVAAEEFRQPIWQASFALQGQDPLPADYAADVHWP